MVHVASDMFSFTLVCLAIVGFKWQYICNFTSIFIPFTF